MSQGARHRGQVIGDRFTLEEELGSGGYGVVWRARDSRTGAAVAIKLLHEHLAGNTFAVERFEREARVLEQLEHPNLARAIAVGTRPTERFLALELVEGVSLAAELGERAKQGRHLALAEVVRLTAEIGGALSHAHAAGIVHRDLKPSNVMLAGPPERRVAKVLDFGIAKLMSPPSGDATTVGRMLGSWLYMAPEQVRGEGVDHRSDVFALGATLFELLTLRRVFAVGGDGHPMPAFESPVLGHGPNNRYNLLRRIVLEPRPRPSESRPGTPLAVDLVVLRALEFEPAARFQSAMELVRALEEAASLAPAELPAIDLARARQATALPEDLVDRTAPPRGPEREPATRAISSTELRTQLAAPSAPDRPKPEAPRRLADPRLGPMTPLLALVVGLVGVAAMLLRSLPAPQPGVPVTWSTEPLPVTPARPQVVPRPALDGEPSADEPDAPPVRPPDRAEPAGPRIDAPAREEGARAPRATTTASGRGGSEGAERGSAAAADGRRPTRPAPARPVDEHAELRAMLAALERSPSDLALAARLSDALTAAAGALTDPAASGAVRRCAAASALRAEVADFARCLELLDRASPGR